METVYDFRKIFGTDEWRLISRVNLQEFNLFLEIEDKQKNKLMYDILTDDLEDLRSTVRNDLKNIKYVGIYKNGKNIGLKIECNEDGLLDVDLLCHLLTGHFFIYKDEMSMNLV